MCIISLGRLCNIISPGREYEARKLAVGYFAENGIKNITYIPFSEITCCFISFNFPTGCLIYYFTSDYMSSCVSVNKLRYSHTTMNTEKILKNFVVME